MKRHFSTSQPRLTFGFILNLSGVADWNLEIWVISGTNGDFGARLVFAIARAWNLKGDGIVRPGFDRILRFFVIPPGDFGSLLRRMPVVPGGFGTRCGSLAAGLMFSEPKELLVRQDTGSKNLHEKTGTPAESFPSGEAQSRLLCWAIRCGFLC